MNQPNRSGEVDGDACSEAGAHALAECIATYWLAQGYRAIKVRVESEATGNPKRAPLYVVRSNMSGGLPPGGRDE